MAFIWNNGDEDKRGKTANEMWGGRIGFVDAIGRAFRRVFDYTGRSTRSEYWWFVVFTVITNATSQKISYSIFQKIIGSSDKAGILIMSYFAVSVVALVTFLVWLPLSIRRIRDAGKSPLWMTSYIISIALFCVVEFIKDEFQSIVIGLGSFTLLAVSFGIFILHLMPSKKM